MGYETMAVIAVDKSYGDIDWGEFKDEIDDYVVVDDNRTVYTIEWSKRTYKVVEYFLDNIAKKLEDDSGFGYFDNETFGIISLGEEIGDIEYWGDYWEFDIEVNRSIDIF